MSGKLLKAVGMGALIFAASRMIHFRAWKKVHEAHMIDGDPEAFLRFKRRHPAHTGFMPHAAWFHHWKRWPEEAPAGGEPAGPEATI